MSDKALWMAVVVGVLIGVGVSVSICAGQRTSSVGPSLDYVRELEERLAGAERIARAATARTADLERRSTEAVDSIAGIAERVVSIADRSDRMGDLDDRIFAIVEELERVYLGLAGVPAVE